MIRHNMHKKVSFFKVFWSLLIIFALACNPIQSSAASYENIYSENGKTIISGEEKSIEITLMDDAKVKLELCAEEWVEELMVEVVDADGNEYFLDWLDVKDKKIREFDLESGTYYIKMLYFGDEISDFGINVYAAYGAYEDKYEEWNEEDEDDEGYFYLSDEEVEISVGETKQLSVHSYWYDDDIDSVKWESNNPEIVYVSKKGKIRAKSEGEAIVTAIVNNDIELQCYVEVLKKKPTYKKVVTKVKKYSDKKNYLFDNIDVGYHSRLYGKGASVSSGVNKKELWAITAGFQPYIDITKKGDTAKVKLQMKGEFYLIGYDNDTMLDMNKLLIYTHNRRIPLYLDSSDESYDTDYSSGVRVDKSKWKTTISSSTEINKEQLNKLIKAFRQNEVSIKLSGESGASVTAILTTEARKNWLKLFEYYKELLELYE